MILTLSYSHARFPVQIQTGDKTRTTRPLSDFIIKKLSKNPTLRHYWKQRTPGRFIICDTKLDDFFVVAFSPEHAYHITTSERIFAYTDQERQEYAEREGFDNYPEFYDVLRGMYGQKHMDAERFVCIQWKAPQ